MEEKLPCSVTIQYTLEFLNLDNIILLKVKSFSGSGINKNHCSYKRMLTKLSKAQYILFSINGRY